jgi:hypothetical protein
MDLSRFRRRATPLQSVGGSSMPAFEAELSGRVPVAD